jgi:hypothetical protein
MVTIKKSKPIDKVKKGDKIKVDGKTYEVDAHYVLIDHGESREMAIEVFDPKSKDDGDAQVRYFNDRIKESIGFYLLKEIVYESQDIGKIEW